MRRGSWCIRCKYDLLFLIQHPVASTMDGGAGGVSLLVTVGVERLLLFSFSFTQFTITVSSLRGSVMGLGGKPLRPVMINLLCA